ncbi:hypothetical protein PO878_04000 [Iamia majanohamensis]|uniref:Terminase small subunit n=1 Tax=Iamia majanohamensis TaxID=467976 RepID=A0AAE9YHI0_9ACTN|nr:hypothetical protein [Iamia majanohamensis]WCO67886.1 hypothetical protein PO878_04000 [Iamia majanohamensis]
MSRGESFRAEVEKAKPGMGPGERVLLDEAVRLVDRLDRFDALISGEADVWCRLVHNVRTKDYEIKIDSAVAEARQTVAELRQVVKALNIPVGGAEEKGSVLDELARRRAERTA